MPSIQFEPNEFRDYLYIHLPQFLRSNPNLDEYSLVKLRKDSNLDVVKSKKLIPMNYTRDDYLEYIEVLKKFKRRIQNAKFHKRRPNYTKTTEYRTKANKLAAKKFSKNKERHNDYCRIYGYVNYALKTHFNYFRHCLNTIKLIGKTVTLKTIKDNTKCNIKLKKIALSKVNQYRNEDF